MKVILVSPLMYWQTTKVSKSYLSFLYCTGTQQSYQNNICLSCDILALSKAFKVILAFPVMYAQTEAVPAAKVQRIFKVVFVGDSGVGKSSFIHRFCSNTFRASFSATIGTSSYSDFCLLFKWQHPSPAVDHCGVVLTQKLRTSLLEPAAGKGFPF